MSATVKCRILRETHAAVFLEQPQPDQGRTVQCWIPRSVCERLSKGPRQGDGSRDATITMAGWLADKHNLETED